MSPLYWPGAIAVCRRPQARLAVYHRCVVTTPFWYRRYQCPVGLRSKLGSVEQREQTRAWSAEQCEQAPRGEEGGGTKVVPASSRSLHARKAPGINGPPFDASAGRRRSTGSARGFETFARTIWRRSAKRRKWHGRQIVSSSCDMIVGAGQRVFILPSLGAVPPPVLMLPRCQGRPP